RRRAGGGGAGHHRAARADSRARGGAGAAVSLDARAGVPLARHTPGGLLMSFGVHPCAETLKTPTSQVVRQWGLLRSSPHWRTARLDRLELGGRAVGQRRVQALAIVDLLDESADRRLCRGEVA